jgi:hypothetical protein
MPLVEDWRPALTGHLQLGQRKLDLVTGEGITIDRDDLGSWMANTQFAGEIRGQVAVGTDQPEADGVWSRDDLQAEPGWTTKQPGLPGDGLGGDAQKRGDRRPGLGIRARAELQIGECHDGCPVRTGCSSGAN